jgi:O-antigen/teichoic acid export membrane protein
VTILEKPISTPPAPQIGMRRNLYSSLAGQWVSALMAILSSLVIARLLTPAELGVFTVTMALVIVLQTLQSTGANEYLLYTPGIGIETRRAALGLSVLSSALLAGIILAISPFAAHFYHSPGMAAVLQVVALNTVLGVLVAPVAAMLAREQAFGAIGWIAAATSLVQSAFQIVFVWLGWSYMGLAWALTASTLASIALHFLFRPGYILYRPAFHGMRPLLGFGSKLFGVSVMTQINNVCPQILIGATGGLSAAAMYGRANTITQIYSQMIARAVDPVLAARLAADKRGGGAMASSLFVTSQALTAISIPFFGFIALYAHLVVPLMFGPQWGEAILPMRILCCGFAVWPLTSPTTALMLAAGRPGMLLRIRAINTILRVLLILLASPFGLPAMAVAVAVSTYINLAQSILAARTGAGIPIRDYARSIADSVKVSMAALLAAWLAPLALAGAAHHNAIATLAAAVAGAGAAWLIVLRATHHPLWMEVLRWRQRRR